MPWCDPCERFWNPGTLTLDGECPRCGAVLDNPEPQRSDAKQSGAPWHFWLFLAAAVVYLAWRAIDGIALLF